jgi:uncharacterized protein
VVTNGDVVMVHEGLVTETDPPRLLGSRCRACGAPHFPRVATCPYCGAGETRDIELSPEGRLWAWTAVTAAPPGYRGSVPFGFGVVELPEGLRVVTRLSETDPTRWSFGEPVRLVRSPLHTDERGQSVMTWAFAPACQQ